MLHVSAVCVTKTDVCDLWQQCYDEIQITIENKKTNKITFSFYSYFYYCVRCFWFINTTTEAELMNFATFPPNYFLLNKIVEN